MSFSIYLYLFSRWIYTVNRAEAKEAAEIADKANGKKDCDLKSVEKHIQNEGTISVISEIKTP